MSAMTAASIYGGIPGSQPTPTPTPAPAGEPESTMATRKIGYSKIESPVLMVVVLLGLVVLLTQVSFRGTIRVQGG
jgi:hypothetical protein